MKISILVISMLIAANVFAAKPDLSNCPCMYTDPGLSDFSTEDECITTYFFVRNPLFKGGREVHLWLTEAHPGRCFHAGLLDIWEGQKSCAGHIGETTESGGCVIEVGDEFSEIELTDQELADCDLALRDLAKKFSKLPSCE